jgi:hypothetical protein
LLLDQACGANDCYNPAFTNAAAWRLPTRSMEKCSIASLHVFVLPLARRMLDSQDDDLLSRSVYGVINEI